jgi:hypothetical protein
VGEEMSVARICHVSRLILLVVMLKKLVQLVIVVVSMVVMDVLCQQQMVHFVVLMGKAMMAVGAMTLINYVVLIQKQHIYVKHLLVHVQLHHRLVLQITVGHLMVTQVRGAMRNVRVAMTMSAIPSRERSVSPQLHAHLLKTFSYVCNKNI